jgi:hypothetical protein
LSDELEQKSQREWESDLNDVVCIGEPKELLDGNAKNVKASYVVVSGAGGAYHKHI